MTETILVGRGTEIHRVDATEWRAQLSRAPERGRPRLAFMTEDHHLVRNFVVTELPKRGKPISPEHISRTLHLPLERVVAILDELERRLFFVVRNDGMEVSWAFPVTAESTGHHVTFSTGERLDAA